MLILASASPRRRELLGKCGYDFVVRTADVEELKSAAEPRLLPVHNAGLKADAVAEENPADVVIGADTIVLFRGEVIGKPRDLEDARVILRRLSGQTHEVLTGISIRCAGRGWRDDFTATTEVTFRAYSEREMERYLSLVNVLDKAGAYGIQEYGEILLDHLDGDLDNVIGLPCTPLKVHLERCMSLPG